MFYTWGNTNKTGLEYGIWWIVNMVVDFFFLGRFFSDFGFSSRFILVSEVVFNRI